MLSYLGWPPPDGWTWPSPRMAGPDPPWWLDLTPPSVAGPAPPAAGPDPPGSWTWPPPPAAGPWPPPSGWTWPPPRWLDLIPPWQLDLTPPPAGLTFDLTPLPGWIDLWPDPPPGWTWPPSPLWTDRFVEGQTRVKTLPSPILRMRAVISSCS